MASQEKKEFYKVFMYGTLKKGQPNHHVLCDPEHGSSRLVGTARTQHRFPLVVATNCNIPFLLLKKGSGHVSTSINWNLKLLDGI